MANACISYSDNKESTMSKVARGGRLDCDNLCMRNRKAIPVCLERSIAVSTNIWAGLFIDLHEAPEMSIPLQTTVYYF